MGSYCPNCICEQGNKKGEIIRGHFVHEMPSLHNHKCFKCGRKLIKITNEKIVKAYDRLIIDI